MCPAMLTFVYQLCVMDKLTWVYCSYVDSCWIGIYLMSIYKYSCDKFYVNGNMPMWLKIVTMNLKTFSISKKKKI